MTRLAIAVAVALLALILFALKLDDSGLPVEATTANAPAVSPDATVTAPEGTATVTEVVSPHVSTTLPTTELQGAVGPATIVTIAEPVEAPREPAPPAPVVSEDVWWRLAMCESGRDGQPRWTFNGLHQGGLQYAPSTWDSYRPDDYPEDAYDATPQQQIDVGRLVLAAQGPGAWPICGPRVGLRRGM